MRAPTAGYVYLADTMYYGWTASVDGLPTKIEVADGYARAVHVGPGFHRIKFVYRSQPFRVGLYISLTALAISLAALLWWFTGPRLMARWFRAGASSPNGAGAKPGL